MNIRVLQKKAETAELLRAISQHRERFILTGGFNARTSLTFKRLLDASFKR